MISLRTPALAKTMLFVGAAVFAGPGHAAGTKVNVSVVDFPFPSGLRAVFLGEPGARSVTIAAVVAHGSADDTAGREGTAHLAEHLWFRSRPGGGPAISERLEALGATWNAFTNYDDTTFLVIVPRDSLAASLRLFADLLAHPLEGVTDTELALEREVVRNELRQRVESTAPSAVHDAITAMVFPAGHRYHRPIVGTHVSLDAITLDDLKRAVEHYRPDATTLVVTADLDASLSGAVLKQSMPVSITGEGALVPRKTARAAGAAPEPPVPEKERTLRMKAAVTVPTVYLAWSLPGGWRDADAAAEVAVFALEEAVGTYLYADYGGGLRARSTSCWLERQLLASLAVCKIEVGAGQDPKRIAMKAVDGVFLSSERAGELATWKRSLRGYLRQIFQSATASRRALETASYVHYGGRVDRPPRLFTDLQPPSIDERKVQKMSKRFNRKRVVTLIVDPGGAVSELVPARQAWVERMQSIDATPPPVERLAKAAVAPDFSRITDVTLANGMRVVVHPHPVPGLARISLFLRGGSANSTPPHMEDFTYLDWSGDALDVSGVWADSDTPDSSTMALELPSSEVGAGLALLRKRVRTTKSTFALPTHEKVVKIVVEELEAEAEARTVATALQLRLFPDHPIWLPPDFAKIREFTEEQASAWVARKYTPANATLLVVGDVDPAVVQEQVEQRFSDWKGKTPPAAVVERLPVAAEAQAGVRVIDRPNATQTALFVACRTEAPDAHARTSAKILAAMIEREATRVLRDTNGATYGVTVSTVEHPGGATALIASSWVQNEAAIPAARLLLDRLRAVGRGDVDELALRRAQWEVARASHVSNVSNAAMTGTLVESLRLDKTIDEVAFSPVWIARAAPAQMKDLLQPCKEREVVVLVGPAAKLGGAGKALGFPE